MPGTYNSNASVEMLAETLVQAPNAKNIIFARKLEAGAAAYDDFTMFEGAEKSESVFWVKRDFTKEPGDKMVFTVQSDLAGPGVIGEAELTGNTSTAKYSNYEVVVDVHRDAIELNRKERKFLAAGGDLDDHCINKLKVKMGRWRMYEMKMALIRKANGNILRPNGKKSRDTLTAADTMSPSFLVSSKPQVQRIGARPINVSKNKGGSPVYRYINYMPDVMMAEIRNSTSYQNAQGNAGTRGEGSNALFTGMLTDWMGMALFENIVMHPDADDHIGDPFAPIATLGTAFGVDSASGACKLIMNSANTKSRFFEWFDGFDYQWVEGQTPVVDSGVYYAWIINPDNSVGFVRYTGSANNGNQITLSGILSPDGAGTSTKGATTLGNISCVGDSWNSTPAIGGTGTGNTSGDFTYTDTFTAGAYIIPANANGTPVGYGCMFGKGAAVRGYGQTDTYIEQDRDYKFVKGRGFEGIWGQAPVKRTDNITHGYGLFQCAIQHPGLEVPSL